MSDELDLNEDGTIRTFPLVQYATLLAADMFAILRLGYATTEAEFERGALQHVQLTMTPVQLRGLAESLLRAEADLLAKTHGTRGN